MNGVPTYVDTEFAAGAVGDAALGRGLYLFHLKCSANISCELERITLNECANDESGPSVSTPRVAGPFAPHEEDVAATKGRAASLARRSR